MVIPIECDCGRMIRARDEHAGKRIRCPDCGEPLRVPNSSRSPQFNEDQFDEDEFDEPPRRTARKKAVPRGHVRCDFCHEYIPSGQYDRHIKKHLKRRADGQQTDYATIPADELDPSIDFATAPRWYRHRRCGEVTGMPEEIIKTYLSNPWFYLSDKTFCTGCGKHVHQRECTWEETGENLQEYTERLRAAKPELRPNILVRGLAKIFSVFG